MLFAYGNKQLVIRSSGPQPVLDRGKMYATFGCKNRCQCTELDASSLNSHYQEEKAGFGLSLAYF